MSDKVIVSVARLERGKNYASLIKWFPSVFAEIPEAKLIIVGSGPEKKNLIKEVHLGNAIIFVEGTTNMEKYLHIADVFCTPTIARGMAVLEAMAAGLPVVGTEPNGAPHVVLDGETGFVVKNNEGDAFAKRIVQLLLNPEFAKRFGAAGKARMHEQFSHVSMVDQLEDVYAEFVADAR